MIVTNNEQFLDRLTTQFREEYSSLRRTTIEMNIEYFENENSFQITHSQNLTAILVQIKNFSNFQYFFNDRVRESFMLTIDLMQRSKN